jgi:hypothetical protein
MTSVVNTAPPRIPELLPVISPPHLYAKKGWWGLWIAMVAAFLVISLVGLMLYDEILIGDYVANPQPGKDGVNRHGSGLADTKLFYPFFIQAEPPARKPNGRTNAPSIAR